MLDEVLDLPDEFVIKVCVEHAALLYNIWSSLIYFRSLVLSDLHSETKGSQFEFGC